MPSRLSQLKHGWMRFSFSSSSRHEIDQDGQLSRDDYDKVDFVAKRNWSEERKAKYLFTYMI